MSKAKSNIAAEASSKTLRKVVSKLSETLNVDPEHTRFPSEDFRNILETVDEQSRARALEWYRRGLRRGFDEATTAVAEGSLIYRNGELSCPKSVEITVKVKFRGSSRKKMTFVFPAEDLGFK